jgi:tetratricopeptide (TPR) repeat protein
MAEDVRSTLSEIIRLMQQQQGDAAELKCREALGRWEHDVNLLAMLGAVLASKGETEQAEEQLLLAIKIEPTFAKPYEDLGFLHLARRDNDGAVRLFEKALALSPNQASAMQGLCLALERAGRVDETRELRSRMRRGMPTVQLLREAEVLRAKGEIAASEQVCDLILRREPENTDALRVLAKAATDDERFAVAEAYLKRIVRLSPNRADVRFDLGKFLRDRGRYQESISQLQAAAHIAPDNPELQAYLGNVFGIVGRTDDALRAYENCLARSPDDAAALIGRGHMLRVAGRADEARESYARCTRVHPAIGTAWWYLASLHGHVPSDEDCRLIEQELDAGVADRESEAGFRFALARTLENREQYDGAWQQYSLGNAAKRSLVSYDATRFKNENEKIKQTFSHCFLAGRPPEVPFDRTPIFIVGMPRSGSTLIEQILSNHSQVQGCGELPAIITLTSTLTARKPSSVHYTAIMRQLDAGDLSRLGREYLHSAASHCSIGHRYFTDKMPANFPHVGFILRILPHARIIDARRGPLATCVANYRQLFAQGKHQSYDLGELGEYYLQYVEMMMHWDNAVPGKVLRVQYEDVVADLEGQVRRLLDFCDLPFESSCIEFYKSRRSVNTASAEQVREPIYTSGLEFWKHYAPYLDELRDVLAPVL